MTVMYDSVTAADIPTNAEVVAGYVDGEFAWTQADWERFPNAVKVRIAVSPSTNDGCVLDCESGDAKPAQCPAWIRMRQSAGVSVPTIYCSISAVPAVQAACEGLTYALWIADYGDPALGTYGVPHLVPGSVATQYADQAAGSGGHYDLSLLSGGWPEEMVPEVPQDYQDKFVLSGPYDWPGVVANLEGIIHQLQTQADTTALQAQLAAANATIAKVKADVS